MAYTLADYNAALAAAGQPFGPITQQQFDSRGFAVGLDGGNGVMDPTQFAQSWVDKNSQDAAEAASPGGVAGYRERQQAAYDALQANILAHENTGFGGMLSTLQNNPVTQGIEAAFLGPAVGGLTGLGATASAAGAGSLIGGGTAAATGGNPLTGALEGGALAGIGSGILNNFGDITSGLGVTGADTAGQSFGQVSGLNSLLDPSGAAGTNSFLSANQPAAVDSSGNFFGSDMPVGIGNNGLESLNPSSISPGASIDSATGSSGAFSVPGSGGGGASVGGIGGNAASAASALGPTAPLDTGDASSFLSANSPPSSGGGATGGTPVTTQGNLPWLNSSAVPGASAADQNFLNDASNSAATTNVSATNTGGVGGGSSGGTKTPNSVSNFLDKPGVGSFGSMLAANAAPLVAGGGLLANAITGNQPVKGEKQLDAAAAQNTANGTQLQSYLTSGQLPPGAQASINQAAQSQKAAIKSRFAQMGSSGSSSEQQELAAVDQWAQGQGSNLALSLLNSGINQSQLGAALYSDIAKNSLSQDQSLASSIAAFASSLGSSNALRA